MKTQLIKRALVASVLASSLSAWCTPVWADPMDSAQQDAQAPAAADPQAATLEPAPTLQPAPTLEPAPTLAPAPTMTPAATPAAAAASDERLIGSDKLLLTGGVTELDGSAGGGLTPWAVIGGNGTRDEIGANAFYTHVNTQAYDLNDAGVLVGFYNRLELSFSQQRFDTENVGAALGLGRGFTLDQNTFGVKVKLAGDALLDQDSWMPQISAGIQYKTNDEGGVHGLLESIGAKGTTGTDFYVSATKLFLDQSLLLNGTVRLTKANQLGILGFGGDLNDNYKAEFEGSAAFLLSRNIALGAEYRMKPSNLGIAKEDDWYDAFLAWAPTKNISITLAYAYLGTVVIEDHQRGLYASAQVGF